MSIDGTIIQYSRSRRKLLLQNQIGTTTDTAIQLPVFIVILVIVLTKAAPTFFVKWNEEHFLKSLCIGNNRLFFSPFFFSYLTGLVIHS